MSEGLLTVEAVAEELKLHPKTVLRFIREGRLQATRVGRQFRILPSDLRSLIDGPPRRSPRAARVTAIVEVSNTDAEFAQRMTALMTGARRERSSSAGAISVDVIYDQETGQLKVIAVGIPGDVARLIQIAEALLES